MKSIIKTFGLLSVLFITLWSCKKDEDKVIITTGDAPALTLSNTSVNLNKEDAEKEAVSFNWDVLNYQWSNPSVSTDVLTYTIQIGKSGDGFRSDIITKSTKSNTYVINIRDLNKMFLDLGFLPNEVGEVAIRLNAGLAPNQPIYSNVVTFTATPYELASYLYVPGAYQGWDPATALKLTSATSNGIYIGEITFPQAASEFKITPEPSWDHSYGDAGGGKIILDGGENFKSPDAGNYQITVNTSDKTIQFDQITN